MSPEVDLNLESETQMPLPSVNKVSHWLGYPEEMSPEVQNKGTSGPTKRTVSPPKI